MGRTPHRRAGLELVPSASAARATAVACTDAIRSRLGAIARDFWDVGELLRKMQDERLYQALGHETFRAYLDAELAVAANQAYKMIRIVRAFVRGDAERVGVERADLLIGYAKLLGEDHDPGELVRTATPIGEKPVTEATVRELQEAISQLRRERALEQARGHAARQAKRATSDLERRVRKALGSASDLGRGTIQVTSNTVVVRFSRRALERRLRG